MISSLPDRQLAPTAIVWRRAAAAIAAATLLLGVPAFLAQRAEVEHQTRLRLQEGEHVVSLEKEFLTRELQSVRADLLFLAQQPQLEALLSGDPAARQSLEREYLGLARNKPSYEQIRVLDARGREILRVNRSDDDVAVVKRSELQGKGNRYYFQRALALGSGEVYVSPLDLNVEHGAIEQPPKPMIRFATPSARDAEQRGVLVINYAGSKLLDKLREIAATSRGDIMLLNREGEYLQAPDREREWGWLLGHSANFPADQPDVWEQIRASERSQFETRGQLYTSEWLPLADGTAVHGSSVAIVTRLPMNAAWDLRPRAATVLLATLLATVIAAFYWARATVARASQDKQIAESEARLRLLSSRLLSGQEEERRRMSRTLHDELGQMVTATALDLKTALRRIDDPDTQRSVRRAIEENDKVLASLHEMAERVRPSVLDDLGLADAIESHVSEYEERTGVSVDVDLDLSPHEPSGATAENLYRIVQEALANVAAHAHTPDVRLELRNRGSEIELTVEDAGRGFDPADLKNSSRLGILGIRERAELLGGEFRLESQPGRGTRIQVTLPLAPIDMES